MHIKNKLITNDSSFHMGALSLHELGVIHDTDFFVTKASATKKIAHLFAEVRDVVKNEIETKKIIFPTEVDSVNGKIFRGENYHGLPYMVLDYPKHFSRESVFAFRTMFWWGNFFSFTMHLQGHALEKYRDQLTNLFLKNNFPKNVYLCIHDTPWQYHYRKDNYISLNKLSFSAAKKIMQKKKFIKFSARIPLKQYTRLISFARESFLLFCPEIIP